MEFCELCASISLSKMRGPNLDRMQSHQPSYLALKESANAGCQLCGFFWIALEQGTGKNRKQGLARAATAHVCERYPGRQISLVAWGGSQAALDRIHITTTGDIPENDDDDASVDPTMHPDYQLALDGVVDLYADPADPAAWHGGVTGRALPFSAGNSEADFQQTQTWLQDCLHNHAACPKPQMDAPLPTRVIDVGPPNEKNEPHLLQSNGLKGSYVALSHCWGGSVPLVTTVATLEHRMRSIPLQSLPKTFREAVIVTQNLGVRYLWIDSLCILQDSRADWEKESAVMGDIYASSFLTIAARGSMNSAGGLFIPREQEPAPCRLRYKCTKHSLLGSMYVRSPVFQHERLRDTPLDTRGWVLQERLLSPRILYFGRHQLYWECAKSTFRQDGRAADVATDDLRSGRSFKEDLDFNSPLPLTNSPIFSRDYHGSNLSRFKKAASLLRWYNIIEEYTIRNLTYQSDKLPALSGIAKTFQKMTGYSYLAGLWKEDLIAGIAWLALQASDEITSPALPSWAWARLKGSVRFWSQGSGLPLRELDTSCEVVKVTYTLTSPHNPFGDIEDSELQVRGRLIEVTFTPSHLPDDDFPTTVFSMTGMPIGRISFDLKASGSLRSFFCLLIHGGDNYAAALALESISNARLQCYRRIGYVSVMSDRWEPKGRAAFQEVPSRIISII